MALLEELDSLSSSEEMLQGPNLVSPLEACRAVAGSRHSAGAAHLSLSCDHRHMLVWSILFV